MAVPSYSTDLIDLTLAQDDVTLYEMSGYETGNTPDPLDPVYPIQGTFCYVANQKNKTGLQSIAFSAVAGPITIATGECIFMWHVMLAGDAIESFLNGGYQLLAGDDTTNFKAWRVGGNDFSRNPYGGWQNSVVDPTNTFNVETGTQTNWTYFGSGINMTKAIQKGDLHGVDATRYGRGTLAVSGGEAANYATFAGMATANDDNSTRWGLFQDQAGSYLWKGLMQLGGGPAWGAVDFRDENVNITIDQTPRVYNDFNRIQINNAGSRVDWTGINISSVPPTGYMAPGNFVVVGNADINFEGCSFTDMGTFTFLSNSTINGTTFRRCEQVDWGSAAFDGCIFDTTRASAALYCEDLEDIDNCTFSGDGNSNAIHMAAAGSYTFVGNTFTGYGASGSPSAAIYHHSGGHLIVNVQGGDSPTVFNIVGSTSEVNNPVILTLTNLVSGSEVRIYTAGTQTELSGVEDSALSHQYPYTYAASTYVDMVIHHVDYVYIRLENYLLLDTSTSIPIQQQSDRWYSNP
jgi:hypothetical protein